MILIRILIDADACPVVDIAIQIAERYDVECIIFCDTSHIIEKLGVKTITVDEGADSVDYKIVNYIQKGDIVITQDYGLAAMCLARKAIAMNQNGLIYDDRNIDSLLTSRYISKQIRNAGGRVKGQKKRKSYQNKGFRNNLINILNQDK